MITSPILSKKLSDTPPWFIACFGAACSFGVYFCMYAFRKPFTAAGFEGIKFMNIDYKVWLVTAQVLGYMLSKFYGIKFISSMQGHKRAGTIVKLIVFSWIALLLFAITPAPVNILFLFLNGFPLGMVWGLVFSFVEGRRFTEFMGAVLSISFIFSSGVVKSVGKFVIIDWHISEMWMPFVTGSFFILPLLLFTWLLNHLPPPSGADVDLRNERKPMDKAARAAFISMFLPGIIMIVSTYILLTVLRDFRDNFANELWTEMGYGGSASVFSRTEIPVSVIVLICMSLLILVRKNIRAFMINHYIIIFGYALTLFSTLLFVYHHISPVVWMTLIGTGLYLSYVPFNALFFERMIATYRINGNVGFIMYVADSFGYLGSILVLFFKQFFAVKLTWTNFFTNAIFMICVFGIAGTVLSAIYFHRKFFKVTPSIPSLYGR